MNHHERTMWQWIGTILKHVITEDGWIICERADNGAIVRIRHEA